MDGLAQGKDIAVLDVAAVFAEVDGDAHGPGGFANAGGLDEVGIRGAASLAQCGHMVNVDTQSKFARL